MVMEETAHNGAYETTRTCRPALPVVRPGLQSVFHPKGVSKKSSEVIFVIQAKAGIQVFQGFPDPGFRRGVESQDPV